jgi:transketolase
MSTQTEWHPAAAAADLDSLCVNTIRFLSVDAVQAANSGHPGLPLDAAPMAYVLWTRFLKHNPADPCWFDRDRFVLSAGHGSMLLYSLLHLTGYNLSLDEIKRFRRWGSETPGHPERHVADGIETTTGPLGQGFANGVGMAMAEAHLAARFNRPGLKLVDHYTYGIVSDGDLMEGVAAEAASLAGHLQLGKLIYFYDNNHVSLSESTELTFSEDVAARFRAYSWHTQLVSDGNDLQALDRALRAAQAETQRPSLILVRTHLGYGSPHKQDTFEAHGSPLGVDEVRLTKENLGWPTEPAFYLPEPAVAHFREALERGRRAQDEWNATMERYAHDHFELAEELHRAIEGRLPDGWDAELPRFDAGSKPVATRVAGGKALAAIAANVTSLVGGSADLNPSTFTAIPGAGDFESPGRGDADRQGTCGGPWGYEGRNLHFGVREHAMGGVLNGLAAHTGVIPFAATFLIFSDYMRPPIRLAAMMRLRLFYIFTHDSVGLGEDGPTHQPVEQLLGLRAVPGLVVMRPADANETVAAWQVAMEETRPVAMILTRQAVPILNLGAPADLRLRVRSGGYVVPGESPRARHDAILVATGSELHLALEARARLFSEGIEVTVVSMPCWRFFAEQPQQYRESVLPPGVPVVSIEAGTPLGWQSYFDGTVDAIAVARFGASAPGEVVMREYGFTVENVCAHARRLVSQRQETSGPENILRGMSNA